MHELMGDLSLFVSCRISQYFGDSSMHNPCLEYDLECVGTAQLRLGLPKVNLEKSFDGIQRMPTRRLAAITTKGSN